MMTRTKHPWAYGSLAVLLLAAGCASSKKDSAKAPDGFYVRSNGGARDYSMTLLPPRGGEPVQVSIQEFTGFVPKRVIVAERQGVFLIETTGEGIAKWSEQPIFLVVHHVPFWQLKTAPAKPPAAGQKEGLPDAIFLVVHTGQQAEQIATALRKRYSLPPEPSDDDMN